MIYQLNKGVNKPIEFKGLKAQYIGFLAAGLVLLLLLFAAAYIIGIPAYLIIPFIACAGFFLVHRVYYFSNKYGEYGLMKKAAKKFLPRYLKFNSRKLFTHLNR
ncbi:DUF4133 domain-containing protein [Mucilaginibacter ginkgonis]|uniref:DUF4133 domain-containing protein n=1 Tax=Mucilaginibacter ginkgonis TaxID=2682091 RepID=A0A6I4HV78_9SPHI|nr:DUF4133 domain-containing protein [Mucilaginibacter ginkgonis]QQL49969.1 DUF4133 domain-containing protein [Mucilaginibacter ginkgonis]